MALQKLTTIGNATIIAYDDGPVLVTDPWIGDEDPAYFGSWILSHEIPEELKRDIQKTKFIWFSHGHPDHLNPTSLERFKGNKILLPDHVGSRIFNDISALGFDVSILPDRKWVTLTENIRIQCITTYIQDAILLIDICGKIFLNLNDAGLRNCSKYIREIVSNYEHSYLLTLAGYGDADMIHFYKEDGTFVLPLASNKPSVGRQFSNYCKITGAKTVIPFSTFHQYQRADSIWAQQFTTPMDAYQEGLEDRYGYIPPFSTIDCNDLSVTTWDPKEVALQVKQPEIYGDSWTEELSNQDRIEIQKYFDKRERIAKYFGFLNFRVGGRDNIIQLKGKKNRGITFEVPRGSLMTSIQYQIFDDLLIGNFMKTTLHNCASLYEGSGNFTFNAAKYGDNGLAYSEEEILRYLSEYKMRAGIEYLIDQFTDKSKDFLIRFVSKDTKLFSAVRDAYYRLR